jgi:multisubunit Na+/H+ antiporter MnhE subunit
MKLFYLVYLFFYFTLKIIQSGWNVAWMVIKGSRGENGLMIEFNTKIKSSWHLVLLFNLISMTPGALSVEISNDGSIIFVHLLDADDKEMFLQIAHKLERLLLKAV